MTIVWGHNNFRLKSVPPHEIGLMDRELSGLSFELRQKYGHLFWIPFFPLDKFWVVRKKDGKLYHCPHDIEMQLKQRFPMRTSIWAWTGPLLIVAGLLIFSISEKMEKSRWAKQAKESYTAAANTLTARVNAIKPNDYLLFSVKQLNSRYYDYSKVPVKVLTVNGDSVVLSSISSKYKNEDKVKTTVSDAAVAGPASREVREAPQEYSSIEDIVGMEIKHGIKDSFTVSKKMLLNAVCHDNENDNIFEGVAIKNFTTQGNCMLKDIVHVEGPVLKMVNLTDEKRDGKYYELQNVGFSVQADSIITFKKDGTWSLSKERQFYFGDIIAIKCNTKDSAILYSSDYRKRVYKNKIDNTGYQMKFEAISE